MTTESPLALLFSDQSVQGSAKLGELPTCNDSGRASLGTR